jgi:hypothetical protein
MKNIYNTIKASLEVDSLGNTYPDVCTFSINTFRYYNNPLTITLTSADCIRFDLLIYAYYQTSDYTDLILWLNNLKSYHDLVAGNEIILPDPNDITRFYLTNG